MPQPYGGTYRQIQIYVDPLKLEARNLSLNDVVKSVDSSNLILPAGDVRIGSKDFNIYANSQFPDANSMNEMPLKSVGNSSVLVGDIGKAVDSGALQYNIVRIDGQRSVYVPIFKQGGDSNTITIVERNEGGDQAPGRHSRIAARPPWSSTSRSSSSWRSSNVSKEATIGLVLTGDDDSGLPGQPARHRCRAAVGSAFDAGLPADHQFHGRLNQHHDSGRTGAGLLAPHR